MIKNYETPINFEIRKTLESDVIEYLNLMEIGQGGPEVGKLSINGSIVNYEYPFGGPFLIEKDTLYAPTYIRKFLKSGFKLAQISLKTHTVELLGTYLDLIYLEKIEDGRIYFYGDIAKKDYHYYEVG